MKLKKGNLAMVLAFILMLSLFFACTIAFIFNNKVSERRSSFVDYINKVAMELQAELEGYSKSEQFCFMYKDGNLLTQSQAEAKKNEAILNAENKIKLAFKELSSNVERNSSDMSIVAKDGTTIPGNVPLMSQLFQLARRDAIKITVTENNSNKREGVALVEIKVKYTSSLKAPFADAKQDEATGAVTLEDSGSTAGRFKVVYNDSAKRQIENPRRYKGITKN